MSPSPHSVSKKTGRLLDGLVGEVLSGEEGENILGRGRRRLSRCGLLRWSVVVASCVGHQSHINAAVLRTALGGVIGRHGFAGSIAHDDKLVGGQVMTSHQIVDHGLRPAAAELNVVVGVTPVIGIAFHADVVIPNL